MNPSNTHEEKIHQLRGCGAVWAGRPDLGLSTGSQVDSLATYRDNTQFQ